jgi:hypothetical protein
MNFENRPTHSLRPYARNARTHSPKQIKQIARSIERFGFNNPLLIDDGDQILAGHGRLLAAKQLNMKTVPCVRLSHLSEDDKKAYVIADNRLAEKSGWDNELLAIELQHLVDIGFDVDLTGFEPAETDLIIEGIGEESDQPENLAPEPVEGPTVSRLGDVWLLGKHILVCGDSTEAATYELLTGDERAEFVFTDPPYNVRINGHVTGLGRIKHRAFAMASGEMTENQFTMFLSEVYALLCKYSTDGSIHQICMDWRHMREMVAALARCLCWRIAGRAPVRLDDRRDCRVRSGLRESRPTARPDRVSDTDRVAAALQARAPWDAPARADRASTEDDNA